ncbi:GDP-L-fucose synthase [Halobacteriovorax sp. DA5]|uniref:GDP-L-fucose synthase family protein n=1 Tax=Halobacteriovorax sp. DA5 TaxID=2067553 RepID=UPI000CD2AA3E|nr:GDP-L-fucose synthase [Halobacteriovorax sp. DA5]POB13200.1 GDP-fucose synthetase [Halobacteriovorax sp. DA5]
MNKKDKILILGRTGLVGSSIVRKLEKEGYERILAPSRSELNLQDQNQVNKYFEKNDPHYVVLAAAKVGGILANDTYSADFIFENLTIQQNVIGAAAFKTQNLSKFIFLGSSCIYPKECSQPIKEDYLLTGPLEKTNEAYAIAKIAGLKLCQHIRKQYNKEFISLMPTNLYGVNDNYDLNNSHVIPGLIARLQNAIDNNESDFKVWGTGTPRREFLYVDDLADACIHILKHDDPNISDIINVGTGIDITIRELVNILTELMQYKGKVSYDSSKPDGTMLKRLDTTLINKYGWQPKVSLKEGLKIAIEFYRRDVLK